MKLGDFGISRVLNSDTELAKTAVSSGMRAGNTRGTHVGFAVSLMQQQLPEDSESQNALHHAQAAVRSQTA